MFSLAFDSTKICFIFIYFIFLFTAGYMHRLRVEVVSVKAGQDIYEIPIGLRSTQLEIISLLDTSQSLL